ncbi:MAG: hypothetical protein WBW88_10130, partial [Rhodothermales bacterium]
MSSTRKGACVPGQKLLLHDEPAEIVEIRSDDAIVIALQGGKGPRVYPRLTFDQLRERGAVRYVEKIDFGRLETRLDSLPESERAGIERAQAYVHALMREGKPGSIKTRQRVIQEVAGRRSDASPPSVSRLHDWYVAYRESGYHPLALNYPGRGRGNTTSRLPSTVDGLLKESIRFDYLQSGRLSVKSAYTRFTRRCEKAGIRKEQVPSYKAYWARTRKLDKAEVIAAQLGMAAARHYQRNSTGGLRTTHVLERVELDGTLLPVVCLSDNHLRILGRPYLIVLRDHFSGSIIGYHAFFGGESAQAAIEALQIAVSPKSSFHARFTHVRHLWRTLGIPELLVADASRGFISDDLDAMCLQLGVPLQTTATKQPWLKGVVESIMDVLQEALMDLPGAVYPKAGSLPDQYDAYKDAAISFSDLERHLARIVVDIINMTPSPIDGMTPDERWQKSAAEVPPLEPNFLPDLFAYGCHRERRVIHPHQGVTYERAWWNSDELQALGRLLPAGTKVEVRINPRSLDHVFVEDPIEKRLIRVPTTRADLFSDLTLKAYRRIRTIIRERYKHHPAHEQIRRAKLDMIEEADRARAEAERRARRTGKPQ